MRSKRKETHVNAKEKEKRARKLGGDRTETRGRESVEQTVSVRMTRGKEEGGGGGGTDPRVV